MQQITYDDFKKLFEFIPFEPEFEFYFKHIPDSYMLIKYEDKVTFCRCGYSKEMIERGWIGTPCSELEYFDSLEELYKAKVVDGICLKEDWKNIDVICLNGTFNLPEEIDDVYEIYGEIKVNGKNIKKPLIDFCKLRNGEEVRCPECKEGIFRTKATNPKTAHHFRCDKCGMMINYD